MKMKNHWIWQALVMGFILILGVTRLLLENASHSHIAPSVGELKIQREIFFATTFDRFAEVEDHCASVASPRGPLDGRWWIPRELSLPFSGKWNQHKGSAPLFPLHGQVFKVALLDLNTHNSNPQPDLKTKVANLTASLCLRIFTNESSVVNDDEAWTGFENDQVMGRSELCISLQGIYAESNSGDHKLCMLGQSKRPLQQINASVRSEWSAPPLVEDDKFLLRLQIPRTIGLTPGNLVGRLTSFRASDDPLFFDPVEVSFPLDYLPPYKFITDSMVEGAYSAEVDEKLKFTDLELYEGKYRCCELIRSLIEYWTLEIIPNWECKGPVDYCNKIGPFFNQGGFSNSEIFIQRFECSEFAYDSDFNISAAIGVRPAGEHNTESSVSASVQERQNTMMIQGTWKKISPGKICLVGCLASTLPPAPSCDFLVCLYIPRSLSLKQRNMVVGFISSIHGESSLSFEHPIQPCISLPYGLYSEMSYRYANHSIAESVLERKNAETIADMIRMHLLRYPWKKVGYARNVFYILGRDLALHSTIASAELNSKAMMNLDIIAIENFVGMDMSDTSYGFNSGSQSCFLEEDQTSQEKRPLLKVAAQLKLQGIVLPLFKLSVEGVYDSQTGKMNLVGCRDVRALTKILQRNTTIHVQDGLDCEIELKLQYPPNNFRLLIDRSVKVSIRSNRIESDPLHFKPVEFHTAPISYIGETEEVIPARILQPVLKILCLCLATISIASQLVYVRRNAESAAYISLIMVGIQALTFAISLTAGIDHFSFVSSDPASKERHDTCPMEQKPPPLFHILINAMLLLAFTFTVKLFQTVRQFRLRLRQVPSEKWVLLYCGFMYTICFVIQYSAGIAKPRCNIIDEFGSSPHYFGETACMNMDWKEAARPYVVLIQDFFLLPQVFWISEWKCKGKHLRKCYYLGITALCVLPQIYNHVYDRYSQQGNIRFGSISALVLAAVVYLRQSGSKYEEMRK